VTTGPFFGPSEPFAVKLTAPPGTYVFHCRVHPAMNASVQVLPAGRAGTTPSQLRAAVASQIRTDVRSGLATERAFNYVSRIRNANGTTTWRMWAGADTPSGHVAVNEFLPRNVPVKVGDSVRWIVSGRSEPHTVTFPTVLHTDIVALCEEGSTDRPATPVHNPPRDPTDFTCGGGSPPDEIELGGGNGRHNVTSPTVKADSGVMMNAAFGVPFGVPPAARIDRYTMRFTGTPGTYTYVCQIHPGMEGTITVR
jgi:plastocyanin